MMENQNQPNTPDISSGKNIAIIAYITLIGLIIAFVMNNDKKDAFASYHIRQSLGLMCAGIALSIFSPIPFLGWAVAVFGSLFILVLWVIGLLNAVNGKQAPVPVLGEYFEKWFASIQ